jgi:hypothetical protein
MDSAMHTMKIGGPWPFTLCPHLRDQEPKGSGSRERYVEDVRHLDSIVDRRTRHGCDQMMDQEPKGVGLGQMPVEDIQCLDSIDRGVHHVPDPSREVPGSRQTHLEDVQYLGNIVHQGIRHEAGVEDVTKDLGDDSEDSCSAPHMLACMDT